MATSLEHKVPCKYLVARYIGDEVRNEPINIGIILQSQNNFDTTSRFITRYHKLRTANEEPEFLRSILDNIYKEISRSKEKDILYKIPAKYNGKIQFTEPRATFADNVEQEVDSLFERYISIEHPHEEISELQIIRLKDIRQNVWGYLKEGFGRHVHRNRPIQGKTSKFKYDFVLGHNKKILHSISFDAIDSVKKTKLFDWHVMDAIRGDHLTHKNFGAIISAPSTNNPKYERAREQFKDGSRILESKKYDLITFNKDKDWRKQIQQFI